VKSIAVAVKDVRICLLNILKMINQKGIDKRQFTLYNIDMAIKTEPNRNELIVKLRDKGMKFEEIGQWLSISRQRAHIIYHKQKEKRDGTVTR